MPTPLRDQLAIAIGAEPSRDDSAVADSLMPIIDHHVAMAVEASRDFPSHVWTLEFTEGWDPYPTTEVVCRTAAEAMAYAAEESDAGEMLEWRHVGRGRLRAREAPEMSWEIKAAWL